MQIAVIVAPIVIGFLGEKVAWHYGFGAAGVGMAIALVVYRWGRKYLPPERPRGASGEERAQREKLTGRDWATMAVLIALLPVLAATAIGNQEIFNAYLLWGEANYNLVFFGETHAGVVARVARRDHLHGDGGRRDRLLDRVRAPLEGAGRDRQARHRRGDRRGRADDSRVRQRQ